MKAMTVLVMAFVLMVNTVSAEEGGHTVKVIATKMDIMYLKVSAAYVGGSLVVFDNGGHKIMESHLDSKKIVVDFFNEVAGDYTVHIEKGGFSQDVKYHKNV